MPTASRSPEILQATPGRPLDVATGIRTGLMANVGCPLPAGVSSCFALTGTYPAGSGLTQVHQFSGPVWGQPCQGSQREVHSREGSGPKAWYTHLVE